MNKEYDFLIKILPYLNKINLSNLSDKQKKNLIYIYEYYKNNRSDFNKKEIRNILKNKRKNLTIELLNNISNKIINKLLKSNIYIKSKSIFCYLDYNNEIITYDFINKSLRDNKIVSIPVIRNNLMIASKIEYLSDFQKNKYGIFEPINIKEIPKNKIDLVITPALTFNSLGFRIGYGGGYYDKFLSDYNGYSIGLIYSDFILEDIIPSSNDVPVNEVITEQ